MPSTLLRCPFCASRFTVRLVDLGENGHVVRCHSCWSQGPTSETRVEAVVGWNTRDGEQLQEETGE